MGKKSSKKKKKKHVWTVDNRFKRLEKEVKEMLPPGKKVVVRPSREKMSEVLLEFIEPYMGFAKTDEDHKKLIDLAVVAWNASLLPESEKKLEELFGRLSLPDPERLRSFVQSMMERKKRYFSDNKRFIMTYEVSGSGEGLYLSVASIL